MLQLRWVTKTRAVKFSTNPGAIGAATYDGTESYKVLQYRVTKQHDVYGVIATEWQDVPDEGRID
jgi:hypothetical protein